MNFCTPKGQLGNLNFSVIFYIYSEVIPAWMTWGPKWQLKYANDSVTLILIPWEIKGPAHTRSTVLSLQLLRALACLTRCPLLHFHFIPSVATLMNSDFSEAPVKVLQVRSLLISSFTAPTKAHEHFI